MKAGASAGAKLAVLAVVLTALAVGEYLLVRSRRPRIRAELEWHTGGVLSVDISADGRFLATGSLDQMVVLWDVSTGLRLRTFGGHENYIQCVAFSPDGRSLAVGQGCEEYGTYVPAVLLRDTSTTKTLRTFESSGCDHVCLAFSPDGRFLVTASVLSDVELWDVSTAAKVRSFAGHKVGVASVAFSCDGRFLATGGYDKAAVLWNVSTGMKVRTFNGHGSTVCSISFSPDGRFLATGSLDATAGLWDVSTGTVQHTFQHKNAVLSVAFSPDGRFLATGSDENAALLWDVTTGRKVATLRGPSRLFGEAEEEVSQERKRDGSSGRLGRREVVWSVDFSPDGRFLATGSSDGIARIWLLPKAFRPRK